MLNTNEHEISIAHKTKMLKNEDFLAFKLSDIVFIMQINVKMPTIVGILTLMSMVNFMFSGVGVEHEKRFITWGPGGILLNCYLFHTNRFVLDT